MSGTEITGIVGVYHANGGPIGEAKYVLGRLLGTVHCGLCDITHSHVRRKSRWDQMVRRLGLRVTMLHLNEMPDDVARVVATTGSPVVMARTVDNQLIILLGPARLDTLGGSVHSFEAALHAALTDCDCFVAGGDGPS